MDEVSTLDVDPPGEFPFVRFSDVNVVTPVEPLWHFTNHDRLRSAARAYLGDADGTEFWMFTTMDDLRAVCQEPGIFSNSAGVPNDPNPSYSLIPEQLDPPLHTKWRHLLSPFFSPQAVARLKPRILECFTEVLDSLATSGRCDYVKDVAVQFPNKIFLEMMGLPLGDVALFNSWVHRIHHSGPMGNQESVEGMQQVTLYFSDLIKQRRKSRKDDLLSAAIEFRVDGRPVADEDLLSMCLLLFNAGLDTVATQLSFSMLHLARHDSDRRKVSEDPELVPSAVEELLRFYSFVAPGRKVIRTTTFRGCPVKEGQTAYLPLVSGNRDPAEFDRANEVLFDRRNNRHIAFGAGPHRCLGAHLAREELVIGLREWHRRIPDYAIDDYDQVREQGGGMIGLNSLPLTW